MTTVITYKRSRTMSIKVDQIENLEARLRTVYDILSPEHPMSGVAVDKRLRHVRRHLWR